MPVSGHTHKHVDENGNEYEHSHEEVFTEDYRSGFCLPQTFPTKQDVLDNVPDPAVKEMMLRMEQLGYDTAFDRFDKQQPQCTFGLSGTCCRICNMGPCKITRISSRSLWCRCRLNCRKKSSAWGAAGAAQHGMHARELLLMLKWAACGKLDLPIIGEYKVRSMAEAFGIKTKNVR